MIEALFLGLFFAQFVALFLGPVAFIAAMLIQSHERLAGLRWREAFVASVTLPGLWTAILGSWYLLQQNFDWGEWGRLTIAVGVAIGVPIFIGAILSSMAFVIVTKLGSRI